MYTVLNSMALGAMQAVCHVILLLLSLFLVILIHSRLHEARSDFLPEVPPDRICFRCGGEVQKIWPSLSIRRDEMAKSNMDLTRADR
ncbi:hypothetical protein BOX15_Mlig030922g2 [Macrostomum lignano]|uniref:Uncharacterized protein n=1 Tax=Macrostomum lignano TaxID=282301 RepID=A0A267E6E5_9PLAT|nr:hypothetical protein BOX15_Mlig030922g1 [Macrostomum lignano]PAA91400.1 hypothetical protein BOX15_Mlig030922g2 [Macrostomum lignano]